MPRSTSTRAVTAAVMMATFLAALDTTVVGTAMPTIIGSLGGVALYSWVFSAYLLTSTTTVPVYGRLADMYGRKPIFLVGATLFIVGSALCSLSETMEMLIFFRAIQGLGAGAVLPVAITVVGDIFPVHERAKVQGLTSAVWATSALAGPAVGGLLVDYLDWRWVFYVNIPFGIVSMGLFWAFLHERVPGRRHSIDYAGTTLLVAGLTTLLVGLLDTGQQAAILPSRWVMLVASATLLALFVWSQARTPEPVLPLEIFRNRVISTASAIGFLSGAILFGVSSYVPPFMQGVLGTTATVAGATLAAVSIGWPVGSTLSARLILRFGYRPVVLLGTGLIACGSLSLTSLEQSTPQWLIVLAMLLVGTGMGFSATPLLVAVQSAVEWQRRGVATASTQFFRSIGGAIGVAVMGTVLNARMREELVGLESELARSGSYGEGTGAISAILEPTIRATMDTDALSALRLAFGISLHDVYVAIALVGVAGLLLGLVFPKGSVEQHAHHDMAHSSPARAPKEGNRLGPS